MRVVNGCLLGIRTFSPIWILWDLSHTAVQMIVSILQIHRFSVRRMCSSEIPFHPIGCCLFNKNLFFLPFLRSMFQLKALFRSFGTTMMKNMRHVLVGPFDHLLFHPRKQRTVLKLFILTFCGRNKNTCLFLWKTKSWNWIHYKL